jgi:capsular polysaccharide biosynthesis protein
VNPRNLGLLRAVDDLLADRPTADVAVLSEDADSKLAGLLGARFPGATVTVVVVDGSTSAQHVRLAAAGPLDLLVDDTRGPGRDQLFRATFHHLRDGGTYVVRNFRVAVSGEDATILPLLTDLLDLKGNRLPAKAPRRRLDDAALAASLGRVVVDRQHVLVGHQRTALAKIAEHEMTPLLEARPSRGRVLASEPGREWRSRAVLSESESTRTGQLPGHYLPLPATLREYTDVVCRPGQVAVQGNVVLPDSYRHIPQPRLVNASLEDLAPGFARAKGGGQPRHLAGSYYYLDSEYRGHFGHAMTEQVSRLWGWKQAKAADPGLKVLMTIKRRELAQFEIDLYAAAGIAEEDLVLVREPVRVDRLVAATPLFSMPHYVHPKIEETWNELGRNLEARAPDRHYPERIFLARRPKKRKCRNAPEIEQMFADHGFEIVFAEDMPITEQARMFRQAEAVAGLAGSALFTICFAETPKKFFVVSSESFIAVNEYMISSVRGHELSIAWCKPEIPMPASGWNQKAFFSPFSLDWEHEGQFLKNELEKL